nr:hypothetical protein [Tanacetum cinerariifolium]
ASTSAEGQNKDSSTSENVASPNPPKPFVKFVKPKDNQLKTSTSAEGQNKDSSTSENVASPNPPKPFVKFVKPKDNQPEREGSKGRQLGLKIIHIGALNIDLVVTDHMVLLCDLH